MMVKKLNRLLLASLTLLPIASVSYANQVQLETNKATNVVFQIAHKNRGGQTVFGNRQSVQIDKAITVPVSLEGYELAGMVIVAINGHELPPSINQFDQPRQCSMEARYGRL